MAWWGVVLVLLAVAGVQAFDSSVATFPENARGNARIVSGWEAYVGQFPYQLSIRMVNGSGAVNACGATIIHTDWALTAAHCTATRISFVVRAGAVNMTLPAVIFETTEYYNHPLYNEAIQNIVQPHDIGVIKFGISLTFNDRIQPVRMQSSYQRNRNYEEDRLIATGWGRTWTNGSAPENMNWVYLLGVSNFQCLQAYNGSWIIQESTICAAAYNVSSQSTCQGDSGGGLTVIDYDGIPTQVGISSFVSSTGCHTDFPAGFIRPGHYHNWYTEVTGIDFDWVPEPEPQPEPEPEPQQEPEPESEPESVEGVHFVDN